MPNAELVAIGSELLLGQIVDTNSAWMARRLTDAGVELHYTSVVGDDPVRMASVIDRALDRADIVITGGGLGPTQDDLTRQTIAEVTKRELVRDPSLIEDIERRFRRRGFIMTPNNERQADIPRGAIAVHNPNGTAPSFIVDVPRGVVVALPGVPHELKWLFDNEVVPYLRKRFALSQTIVYRVLKVIDLGESLVDDRIGHLMTDSGNPAVGVLAHPGQVDVRITAKADNVGAANVLIDSMERRIREPLGKHVFGVDHQTLESVIADLLDTMAPLTLASYEDVTGGDLALRLRAAMGDRFLEGVVANDAYAMDRLTRRAGLDAARAAETTCSERAHALAAAVRAAGRADIGLAAHGVPDAEDASLNLAKGETVIAIQSAKGTKSRVLNTAGYGAPDRERTCMYALSLLREALKAWR